MIKYCLSSRGKAGESRERKIESASFGGAARERRAENIPLLVSEMQGKQWLLFLRERAILSISEAGGPDFYNLLHFRINLPEVGSVERERLRAKHGVGKCPESGTGRGIHLDQSVVIFSPF